MNSVIVTQYPHLPPSDFYEIEELVYRDLNFKPENTDAPSLEALFQSEAATHEIYFYMIPQKVRLVGIFPMSGDTCYFAFWEGIHNLESHQMVFQALFETAHQLGYQKCTGPYHFSTFHRYRTRLQTPSWGMFNREPVNPEYYALLLQSMGFGIQLKFESQLVKTSDIPKIYEDKAYFVKEVEKIPFSFLRVNEFVLKEHELDIYHLIHDIFGANPGFKALTLEQFRLLYNADYARSLCPYTSVIFIEKSSGKLAAISLCQPNYAELNLPDNEKLDFNIHYPMLKKKTLLAKTVGVHPDFRQQGLMSFLAAHGMLYFNDYYEEVIFCLMREDNFSRQFTKYLPFESCHYALFKKGIV